MSDPFLAETILELERHGLLETADRIDWTRRDFFRLTGGGLIVALILGEKTSAQQPPNKGGRQRGGGGPVPQEIGAWIHIGEDNKVTVYTGKVEIGQNVRTALTQVAAEELRVPAKTIHVVMGDTSVVPYDMGTFGSGSSPRMAPQIRRAAAAAREALIDLAAEQSKLDREKLTAKDGKVTGPNGDPEFTFGQLTKGQKLMKVINAEAGSNPTISESF